MQLTKVTFVEPVAAPSNAEKMPKSVLTIAPKGVAIGRRSGLCRSLELRMTPLGGVVVVDDEKAIPLSNVREYEPPPKKRGRPVKPSPGPDMSAADHASRSFAADAEGGD